MFLLILCSWKCPGHSGCVTHKSHHGPDRCHLEKQCESCTPAKSQSQWSKRNAEFFLKNYICFWLTVSVTLCVCMCTCMCAMVHVWRLDDNLPELVTSTFLPSLEPSLSPAQKLNFCFAWLKCKVTLNWRIQTPMPWSLGIWTKWQRCLTLMAELGQAHPPANSPAVERILTGKQGTHCFRNRRENYTGKKKKISQKTPRRQNLMAWEYSQHKINANKHGRGSYVFKRFSQREKWLKYTEHKQRQAW